MLIKSVMSAAHSRAINTVVRSVHVDMARALHVYMG